MKRIALFLVTNLAVMVMLGSVIRLLGADRYLTQQGLDLPTLLVFSLIVGFSGSIVSLLISKPMARWTTGARVITAPANPTERWLLDTVAALAQRAGVRSPEVAVYEGEPNAFATGAFRNSALVAVSTGLLQAMPRDEIEAVLGHELGHVANGDMVTLTLVQGVVNTFVVFLARVVGLAVDRTLFRSNDERRLGPGYYLTVFVCEIVFGLLASMIVMAFSRHREFRADRQSARLLGSPQPMIGALNRLAGVAAGALPTSLRAMGITGTPAWMALFASHPSIERRIAALRAAG
ncbi:protease HtpX [Aquabacterium sp.]|uniref:protease HtpX n=1 Tax=Aquabacterium sp. TaxID=1872578 RepID=UPI003783BF5B